jgi:long-chain acyl-CoA synthetase
VTGYEARTVWDTARYEPDKPAVINSDDGSIVTFGQLADSANRFARVLIERGLKAGDVVAAVLGNDWRSYAVILGALQSGVYLIPVNAALRASEIEYILRDSDSKVFVASADFPESARAIDGAPALAPLGRLAIGEVMNFESFDALVATADKTRPEPAVAGERMYYTSGSTGQPKGVRRPLPAAGADAAVAAAAERMYALYHLPRTLGMHLVTGPLYYSSPQGFSLAALNKGETVLLMRKWSAEESLGLIQRYRVTSTFMVPTMFHRYLALPADVRERYDVSSLRKIVHAAAPCSQRLKQGMIEWVGPIVDEFYSSTEIGGTYVDSADWLGHPGTVGRPYSAEVKIRILNDEGVPQPAGTTGTIFFKITRSFEYLHDPDKLARSTMDGYFTAGDLGWLDDDGYLYIGDRRADLILVGGRNVYPAEVEGAVASHPAIADIAVVGLPNDEWGEEVLAVVELSPGHAPSADLAREIIAFARGELAGYKSPRRVEFVEKLQRDDSGKLRKHLLRAQFAGR